MLENSGLAVIGKSITKDHADLAGLSVQLKVQETGFTLNAQEKKQMYTYLSKNLSVVIGEVSDAMVDSPSKP